MAPRAGKRARGGSGNDQLAAEPVPKRARRETGGPRAGARSEHAVLSQLYGSVQSLRDYVLARLPRTSRLRRKKVAAIGDTRSAAARSRSREEEPPHSEVERALAELLDSTLVGHSGGGREITDEDESRWEQWASFPQRGDDSYVTLSEGVGASICAQSEIVDFAIWSLFEKSKKAKTWPKHLLCDGFRRSWGSGQQRQQPAGQEREIPGVICVSPNPYVQMLKESPWPELLLLLGKSGERIMIDLILDCAIFKPIKVGEQNFCQISGIPLSETGQGPALTRDPGDPSRKTGASDITFARYRMMYARAALNARGRVHFGLRHIHVLNRSPQYSLDGVEANSPLKEQNRTNTMRVLMYIFPRQFGLHNAFTSKVDYRETSQRFKDYTLREEEIALKFGRLDESNNKIQTPKRLRGRAVELVEQMQKRHQRCSYSKLMEHYCPLPGSAQGHSQSTSSQKRLLSQVIQAAIISGQNRPASLVDLAVPPAKVSAFCQAVLLSIIPSGFWGSGTGAEHNRDHFSSKVHHFVTLRRLENMTLEEVLQGMKIASVEWLASAKLLVHNASQSDMQKRKEIFAEFIYFAFDSIIIPLIRSNFYVTESNGHRYRLFFFRHDVWRQIAEPAMTGLKASMLEEVKLSDARQILDSRSLGFSQIRLLPKATGMRAISNLRRRTVKHRGRKELGPGINKILAPAHAVLKLEKSFNEEKLGASLFAVGDIYKRIHPFKLRTESAKNGFYFAKVDVQRAFDTIPQQAIVSLLASIPQHQRYCISRHLEVSPGSIDMKRTRNSKIFRRWTTSARTAYDRATFLQYLESGPARHQRNSIYVDNFTKKQYEKAELLQLVTSHIQDNLVKVGKKFYRQKQGIPQGSVLSTILCNYFYADLEARMLSFLKAEDCLLLRLIDDFLLITTDRAKASRFIEIMHRGVPDYGVTVNPAKTLVNFDLAVNGYSVPRTKNGDLFPYCGTLIDCGNLNVSRSRDRDNEKAIYDSLTIEYSRTPGQSFQRKILNSFKLQAHLLFYDTQLNSPTTALSNISAAYSDVATKMWAYIRSLPTPKQPRPSLIIGTITKLVSQGYRLLVGKRRRSRYPGYVCNIAQAEVQWLAYKAFHRVLTQRQARHGGVLAWLDSEITALGQARKIRHGRVSRIESCV